MIRGRYHLQSLLGHGGMGMVWSAYDHRLDRTVALKLLRPDVPESTALQMEREARAAARIDDQRIVTVLDLDHMEDGRPFLVLELHDGWTLSDELRDGPLPPSRFLRLAEDLSGGLASAHACGVMHRDIKPANVLAEQRGFRITDFGLASIDTDPQTEPNLMGTLAYIAPERLHGAPGTFTADVFSACVVLFEAATGSKPYQAATPADAIMAVRSRSVPPLPDHVPSALADAIRLGLDPDPDRRPTEAGELWAAVHATDATGHEPTESVDTSEQTRPIEQVQNESVGSDDTTSEMLRPRSGATSTFPVVPADDVPQPETTDPRPSARHPAPATGAHHGSAPERSRAPVAAWRRPDLLVAAAVVLTLVFVLGTIVSGGDDQPSSPPEPATISQAPAGGEEAPPAADANPDRGRLQSTLERIEELGR